MNILYSKTSRIPLAAFFIGISIFLSRLLGILRDNLLANFLDRTKTDVYFAAFRIPDFVYAVLIMGGVSAVFLPLFAESFKRDKKAAEKFFNDVLFLILIVLSSISLILAFFTPQLINLIAPGFSSWQKQSAVSLTRILFLSQILLGVSAVFSNLLQYFKFFFAYSLAPVFYNVGIILGIVLFEPIFGLKGLVFGVVLGALMHLLIQLIPFFTLKLKIKPSLSFNNERIRSLLTLAYPRIIGFSASQLNLVVLTAVASTLKSGALSVFNFSLNLYWLPIGLIGVSFTQAAFPFLSKSWGEKDKFSFNREFSSAFLWIFFFSLPASFFVLLLSKEIVSLVFSSFFAKSSYFSPEQISLTAACLAVFSVSIFAQSLIPFLSRVFASVKNTKTPAFISFWTAILNIALVYFFIYLFKQNLFLQGFVMRFLNIPNPSDVAIIGLPSAFALASFFQVGLLLLFLRRNLKRKIEELHFKKMLLPLTKIILASLGAALLIFFLKLLWQAIFAPSLSPLMLFLEILVIFIAGSGFYLFLSSLLGLTQSQTFLEFIRNPFSLSKNL